MYEGLIIYMFKVCDWIKRATYMKNNNCSLKMKTSCKYLISDTWIWNVCGNYELHLKSWLQLTSGSIRVFRLFRREDYDVYVLRLYWCYIDWYWYGMLNYTIILHSFVETLFVALGEMLVLDAEVTAPYIRCKYGSGYLPEQLLRHCRY